MDEVKIGNNIKVLRTSKQISQKQLAQQLGITPNYLSMIENDAKRPSLTLMQNLAAVLNIPLAVFFGELSIS